MEAAMQVIAGLILAGILWVAKGTSDNRTTLAVLSASFTRIEEDVKQMQMAVGELRKELGEAVTSRKLLMQRLDAIEEQEGTERRSGIERRKTS